jgi:hypothetical protein
LLLAGHPRKYGPRLCNAAELNARMRPQARSYTLHVYRAMREILAADRVVMLRTLRSPVRVDSACAPISVAPHAARCVAECGNFS